MNYKSAFLLRCPAIPKVRIALVGLGNRGTKTLVRYAFIGNAEISCIVDVDSQRLARANKLLRDSHRKEALTLCGPDAWKEACQLPDIDLIYICTEWRDAAFIKLGKLYNEKNLFICHRISLGFRYVSTKGCEGNN